MLLQVGYSPEDAFEELNRLASVEASAMGTTAVCVEARPDSGRLRVVSAGHLPPILMSEGSARVLTFDNAPPLGVGIACVAVETEIRPESSGTARRPRVDVTRGSGRGPGWRIRGPLTHWSSAVQLIDRIPEVLGEVIETVLNRRIERIGRGVELGLEVIE